VGQVVVAGHEEDGDAGPGEAGQALGELPLVRLGGLAALVGVAGEEDQVGLVGDGVGDELVEGAEEVDEARRVAQVAPAVLARREPAGQRREVGLDEGPAVALDADVEVREVDDAQTSPPGPLS